MAKRVDYQNPNNDLDEVHERRKAEIRAWAEADQRAADERRGLIQSTQAPAEDDWAGIETNIEPQEEPEAQPEPKPEVTPEPPADPEPEQEEKPAEEEKPAAPAKKAPAKKAAAPAKDAPSKE